MPSFITDILESLGWTDGTLIPVSNEENKHLELLLDQRNKEIIKLKAESEAIGIKQNELENHKRNLLSEHRENMHLLYIHNEQNSNEDHLVKLTITEAGRLKRDVDDADKTCKELASKGEKMQGEITRIDNKLKKKGKELGDDADAIREWRNLLSKGADDISTIEKFSKNDAHQIEVIDDKRRRVKLEHDKKQLALAELCANILCEEKAAERISNQVSELLGQRRHIISTWTEAVKHLRQRDKDITRMQVELEMQRAYARQRDEHLREKSDFLDEQNRNNWELERYMEEKRGLLSKERQRQLELSDLIKDMNNEYFCLKRQVTNTAIQLSNCRMDNKRLLNEKDSKENLLQDIKDQIEQYKMKLKDLMDSNKTSEQRMRQLEDMLKNEEKYTKQVIQENEKLQQCIFKTQQNLSELTERESMIRMAYKGYKLSITQADVQLGKLHNDLVVQEEILYKVSYNILDINKRIDRIEGSRVDLEEERQLEERKAVLEAAKAERDIAVKELNLQLVRLEGDERRLIKLIMAEREYFKALNNRAMELASAAEGGTRELAKQKKDSRSMRAEEAALALRTQHADRAVKQLEDRGLSLEKAVVGLKAAVMERCAESEERMTVLAAQRRCLLEEKTLLTGDINYEKLQVEQLKSKYEVYLGSLGRDESGEPLSLTYFKLKNAQEKNELQEQGDALDVSIRKSETEIAALEATLHVLDTANRNFSRSLGPAQEDDPEMRELKALGEQVTVLREKRKRLVEQCRNVEQIVESLRSNLELLEPKEESIIGVRDSILDEISKVQTVLQEQHEKIQRAETQFNNSRVRARRRIKDSELMENYRADVDCRMAGEANRSAVNQLWNIEGINVDEKASEWGVNLSLVYRNSVDPKKLTLSNASKQGSSLRLDSPCSSGDSQGSMSPNIKSKLLAVRAVRSPLTSQDSVSSIKSQSVRCPSISVVNIDLGVDPAKESPSTALMRKNIQKKILGGSKSSSSKCSDRQSLDFRSSGERP